MQALTAMRQPEEITSLNADVQVSASTTARMAVGADTPARPRAPALLLSLLLHLAPLAVVALPFAAREPLAAGEEVMEIEMVIAEAASPAAPLSDAPTEATAEAPSPEVAQMAQARQDERPQPEDTEGEAIAQAQKPEAAKAETSAIALASAAPPPAAEVQHAAASQAYHARLAKHLARFKRFPAGVKRHEAAGQVVVRFTIDREGRVLSAHIVQPSGIIVFDEEAQSMIRRAEPYPAPPATGAASFTFTLPVSYRLRD